jgi:hypothetical protein
MTEITEVDGFKIGDKVWADKAKYDNGLIDPYVVVGFKRNLINLMLVLVVREGAPAGSRGTSFYPEELSHRD